MILKSPNFVTFPIYLWQTHTLLGAQNGEKRGFYSIFVVGSTNFWIMKIVFLAFFEAKMTKIFILNQKLIFPNDYQQFWVHFDYFFFWTLPLSVGTISFGLRISIVVILASKKAKKTNFMIRKSVSPTTKML